MLKSNKSNKTNKTNKSNHHVNIHTTSTSNAGITCERSLKKTPKTSQYRKIATHLEPTLPSHPGSHINLSSSTHNSLHNQSQQRKAQYDVDSLLRGIKKNDRRSLARAITLIESTRPDHNDLANELLCKILDERAKNPQTYHSVKEWEKVEAFVKANRIPTFDQAEKQNLNYPGLTRRHPPIPAILDYRHGKPHGPLRIGVSGTPGVGKSTFLEHMGMFLIEKYGLKVAVLSIDPSSLITGGSILGDKTRMQRLALNEQAYIRPSPSKGILGGIAQNTAEVINLLEYSNYDLVFVETVGVGQSEVHVSQVTDMLLMLMNVGGGDELQGIKKGVMEAVDILVVTKTDGDLYNAALRTKADYSTAMQMYTTRSHSYGWTPRVLLSSIKEDKERYLDSIWATILDYEHVLNQPISRLDDSTLSRLNFTVDRSPAVKHAHHTSDSSLLHHDITPEKGLSVVNVLSHDERASTTTQDSNNSDSGSIELVRTLLDVKRANQRVQWMWSQINQTMMDQFRSFYVDRTNVDKTALTKIQSKLINGLLTPRIAAKQSFDAYITHTINKAIQEAAATPVAVTDAVPPQQVAPEVKETKQQQTV